jgi:hypothetical protein
MTYLDFDRLDAIDEKAFQAQKPYPWINPERLLGDEAHGRLLETLPELELFDEKFGLQRKFGQQSHDRYGLEYVEGLPISPAWQEFVDELRGDRYRSFLARLFGHDRFRLRFHWHYTPNGCSVSPHCDSNRKLGSHIFYLNSASEWDVSWGGGTIVLDDGGRLSKRSAPKFEDFDTAIEANAGENRSFLFHRRTNSWHGVKEIACPTDKLRKAFIVVFDDWGPLQRILSGRRRGKVESY